MHLHCHRMTLTGPDVASILTEDIPALFIGSHQLGKLLPGQGPSGGGQSPKQRLHLCPSAIRIQLDTGQLWMMAKHKT